jgi:hypothetical protein
MRMLKAENEEVGEICGQPDGFPTQTMSKDLLDMNFYDPMR